MIATWSAVFAVVTFGLPALAWGALAAAVPVLIHLILRQRPRREVLPTLRFLLQAHQASSRAHRLKHLLLLACRMMAILLVVGLLMKTACAPAGATHPRAAGALDGPVSAVFVIDDSASMQYRYQGKTRLEDAQAWARNLLTDPERFPPGSEVTIVTGSADPIHPLGWSRDARAMARLVSDIRPAWHDRSMAALLRLAYAGISKAGHPRTEVYLFTDLTESAWQEPPPDPPATLAGVFILDVGRDENRNLALGHAELPPFTLSANAPAAVEVRVRAPTAAPSATVTLSIDGRPRDRQPVNPNQASAPGEADHHQTAIVSDGPAPRTETTLTFTLPPLPEGPHELLLRLEPDDALLFDNLRFACISVGRIPDVIVVGEEGGVVADLVSAMIAPPALPPEAHRFRVQRIPAQALSTTRLEGSLAVILADPTGLTPGGWQSLSRYRAAGGVILFIPGPHTTPEIYADQPQLLPAEIRGTITPSEPITLAAADLSHPALKPFTDPGIDSINDRLVYRRLDLGTPRAGTTIVAPFSDRTPAILDDHAAPGRVMLFAFSPDRDWSQFGTQAGPLIVLLHSLLESLAPPPDNIQSLIAGRLAVHQWPAPASDYTLHGPASPPAPLPAPDGTSTLPADRPGHYKVFATPATTQPALLYSVNVAESESEMNRITDEALLSRFPPGLALVVHEPADLPSRRAETGGVVSWTVPLALVLLVLLFIESFFANRFYGKKLGDDISEDTHPPLQAAGGFARLRALAPRQGRGHP